MFHHKKPKQSPKIIAIKDQNLFRLFQETLKIIKDLVGATFGPGGKPIILERQEINLSPIVTKDGVSVIKYLSFKNPLQQLILEIVRDASVKTAVSSGDGTTTAVLISYFLYESILKILNKNKKISPQKLIRDIRQQIPLIEDFLNDQKIQVDDINKKMSLLRNVALVANNYDYDVTNKILECFDLVGDDGHLSLVECFGDYNLRVENLNGFVIESGLEESCRMFANGFVNGLDGASCVLPKPIVLCFDGYVNDIQCVLSGLNKLYHYAIKNDYKEVYVALIAHGFSESVLGDFHLNWSKGFLRVLPVLTTATALLNSRTELLYDVSAYCDVSVFNPINNHLNELNEENIFKTTIVDKLIMEKHKTTIFVKNGNEKSVESRISLLKERLNSDIGAYEKRDLDLRIGKLTNGIAQIIISCPSSADAREIKDRAEDSWLAVQKTNLYGALPGSGKTILKLSKFLYEKSQKEKDFYTKNALNALSIALNETVNVLFENFGFSKKEIFSIKETLLNSDKTFDLLKNAWVEKDCIVDSFLSVSESIKNAIFVASLLASTGGLVAFERDDRLDLIESQKSLEFVKS